MIESSWCHRETVVVGSFAILVGGDEIEWPCNAIAAASAPMFSCHAVHSI
jgi:hypothetical protein